jgi:16S rRNA (adenine1518-N6/adenine1519-N6)-dimethyltransferase
MPNEPFFDKSNLQNVRAKKYLGQHFLRDLTVAERIADAIDYEAIDHLIEIGPGTGVLTQYLLSKPVDVTAFEVDRDSITYLETHLKNELDNNLSIVNQDFLKADLNSVSTQSRLGIIGNFPYNISSQIVFKALENRDVVVEFVGMFQKEVAQRICATSGNKTYGILSVLTQAFFETEYLFTVPPHVFSPPPKVDSGVIRLTRRPRYKLDCDEDLFFKVVKTAFQQRRKTLRNSLKTFNLSDVLKVDPIFAKRPERLSYLEFVELTNKIEQDAV